MVVPVASVPTKLALRVFPGWVIHTFRLVNPAITRPVITFPELLTTIPLLSGPALRAVHNHLRARVAGLGRPVDRHLRP